MCYMLHNQNSEGNGLTRYLTFGNMKQLFVFFLSKSLSFFVHRQNIWYDYRAYLAAPSCLVFFSTKKYAL